MKLSFITTTSSSLVSSRAMLREITGKISIAPNIFTDVNSETYFV